MAVVLPTSALKALVNLYIQANGVKAITGPVLQSILNDIIDSLESDYDTSIATAGGTFLKLDGSTPMAGNLDIASYQILLQFLKIASNQLYLINSANQAAILDISGITTNKTITVQDKNHTLAGLDDITSAIAALVDSSPATLDTLNELAAALGDDPNFATTVTNSIAAKLPLAGGVMSGDIELNGNAIKNNTGAVLLKSSAGLVNVLNILSGFIGVLNLSAMTANRTISFQDKDHTVAGLDDIKNIVTVLSATPVSHTGDVVETVKYTQSIPANTYTTHDKIIQEILASAIGGVGVKTIKCYINTTADLAGTPILISTYFTNNLLYSLESSFFVSSPTSTKSFKPGNSNAASYTGSNNGVLGSFAINWTIQQYLVVTVQLAVGTDLIQLEGIFLNRSRK